MNKAIPQKSIIFAFILSFFPIFSGIIEIKHFYEALNYITPGALVLLDIDNTTLEPENADQMASEQWFSRIISKFPTLDAAVSHYCVTALNTPFKSVESTIPKILHTIQEQGILLGFTMRSLVLAPQTTRALHYNGINLQPPIPDQGFMIDDQFPVLVYQGIIFCQGKKNGVTLFTVLDANNIYPEVIIMIDDKRQYLEALEEDCNKRGIQFLGLRYGYLDEKVQQFIALNS